MIDIIRSYLRANLSPQRYRHIAAVEHLMLELATDFAVNREEAQLAALGHDILREEPPPLLLWIARQQQLALPQWLQQQPLLLHGPLAANYIQFLTGSRVPAAVAEAMAQHTLGAENMTQLTKLLFCADYLEPGRQHLTTTAREQLLALAPAAMFFKVVQQSCRHQQKKGALLPPTKLMWETTCG